jgi:hypothetical protein
MRDTYSDLRAHLLIQDNVRAAVHQHMDSVSKQVDGFIMSVATDI